MKIIISANRNWDFVGDEAMRDEPVSLMFDEWNEDYVCLEISGLEGKILIKREEFKKVLKNF